MEKLIMHRNVRISPYFVRMWRPYQHWPTNFSTLLSLSPPLVDASDYALHSLTRHRLRYALRVAVVRLVPLTITASISPHPALTTIDVPP